MGLWLLAARMKSAGISLVPWWTSWKKECWAFVQGSPKRIGPVMAELSVYFELLQGSADQRACLPVVYFAGEPSEVMVFPLDSMDSCCR